MMLTGPIKAVLAVSSIRRGILLGQGERLFLS